MNDNKRENHEEVDHEHVFMHLRGKTCAGSRLETTRNCCVLPDRTRFPQRILKISVQIKRLLLLTVVI